MMNFTRVRGSTLRTDPYRWAEVNAIFSASDARALAASFPYRNFKTVSGYGGEKDYAYEAAALVAMGADRVSSPGELSAAWRALALDFLSPDYRSAMSILTGCDLATAPLEVNVFHYGPGAELGPHADLADKLVTHVLYCNAAWRPKDGGCLGILRSKDASDVVREVPPLIGNSVVLVRSEQSWHAVSRVVPGCRTSRRSLTATFYRPGSISTLWPPGDVTPLHEYRVPRRRAWWWPSRG